MRQPQQPDPENGPPGLRPKEGNVSIKAVFISLSLSGFLVAAEQKQIQPGQPSSVSVPGFG
jgi:hypothetical protein